jgi:nicotinate-nucleotide adenylyltransferase
MKRIGILGGTFDPPHIGHLIIAQEVLDSLQLEEVWFIPTYEPPHKNKASVQVENRIEMLQHALTSNESFQLNTIEVNRAGKSYTYDTMIALREQYPGADFHFIIGADMVEYLPKWYKIDELINLVRFVGVKRSGYKLETNYPIIEVNIPLVDISSTLIRKRLQENKSIQYLVPESVHTYIKEHGFYAQK